MTDQTAQLLNQARTPPEEREKLAHSILDTVDEDSPELVAKAWDEEIKRRIDEIDRGEAELIPGEQVFEEARARARR
jgi:putative addiction module component (TIGR02574 family)